MKTLSAMPRGGRPGFSQRLAPPVVPSASAPQPGSRRRCNLSDLFNLFLVSCSVAAFGAPAPAPGDLPRLLNEAAACRAGQSLEPFRGLEALVRQSVSQPAVRKPLEAGLVKLLGPASSFEARRFACQQLGIIGSQTALPALAALLGNDQTAGIACLALTTYPPGKADEVLRDALAFASGTTRIQIFTALGDRRDFRSVKLLAQSARDPDRAVAEAAIAALGKIGHPAARRAIAALRPRADPALGPALTEATLRGAEDLAAAGDRKGALAADEQLLASAPAAYVRRSALEALLRLDANHRRQRILAALHGLDSALKPVAIAAVRTLPPDVSSEPFAAELHNLSPAEQVWMIESLAARADVHARLAISVSVFSPQAAVRLAAIDALSQVGDASLVPMFARALGASKSPGESRAIESALVNLRGGAATDKSITSEAKRCTGNARVGFLAALARRVGPAANPTFFGDLENSDPAVARAAFRALGKTAAQEEVPALLDGLANVHDKEVRPDAESAAAQALAKVQSAQARSAMVRRTLSQAKTADSRAPLLGLLPGCADAPALAALKAAAADSDPTVREAAIAALADWPDAAAWDTLAASYGQPANEALRGLALRGLVRLVGEENAHPAATLVNRYLLLLAGARTDADFKLILGALGGATHPDALRLAVGLLAKPGVRAEAEVAVKKITEALKAQHPEAAQEALRQVQPAK